MPGSRAGSSGSFFQGGGSGRPAWASGGLGGHGQQLGQRVFAEDLVDALGGAGYGRRGDEVWVAESSSKCFSGWARA